MTSTKATRVPGPIPFKAKKLLREAINEYEPVERRRKMRAWLKYLDFLVTKKENYQRKVIL